MIIPVINYNKKVKINYYYHLTVIIIKNYLPHLHDIDNPHPNPTHPTSYPTPTL